MGNNNQVDEAPLIQALPVLVSDNKVIPYLKVYLALSGQWFPYAESTSKTKKGLYALWQFLICCGVGAYFCHAAFNIWGFGSENIAEYFVYYPITTIEKATWEFRWLITCYIGIMVYNNAIRDGNYFMSKKNSWRDREGSVFAGDNLLSVERWKEARNVLLYLWISLLVLCLLSVMCNLGEIDFHINHDYFGAFFKAVILKIVDRFFTFSLFCVLCAVIFILGSMVKQYCEEIKTWPRGENIEDGRNEARKRLSQIKTYIRSAGVSFQVYLSVHFLLLICTFFLGVCSCFEQMEVRISENVTLISPLMIPHYAGFTGLTGNFSTGGLLMMNINARVPGAGMHAVNGMYAVNASSASPSHALPVETIWLKRGMKMIAVNMVIKTFESLLLYLVPVMLMIRLENQLRLLVEAVEDSDCKDQKEKAYLFENTDEIRIMCKFIKTGSGLRVFGYSVPTFKAFILAAFGPFIAVIIRRLLWHIGMAK